MNYRHILYITGNVLKLQSAFMLLPLLIGLIYKESFNTTILGFGITSLISLILGVLLCLLKTNDKKILPRASFLIVCLSWIIMSLFGALPLIISRSIPNFFDAFFEMSSGFTTTGASICNDVEALPHSILFWRSFSHWIGGMGVIVFILAIIPDSKDGSNMHILRAESPGPQVGKLVSKIGATARILYLIYIILTLIEFTLLIIDPKMDLFTSITITLGTAGTGGFGVLNSSIGSYSAYSQYTIAIFMMLFGVNFSLFYLLLLKKFKMVFNNDELRVYLSIIVVATLFITFQIYTNCKAAYPTFEEAFRHSFFQVASILSTTGYSTTDYSIWPQACLTILVILMILGACAGSTAGGSKISRIIIVFKAGVRKVKEMIHPGIVKSVKMNGEFLDDDLINMTQNFIITYFIITFITVFIISFDGFDLTTNLTAVLACISNVGPGLGKVGPTGNYSEFSNLSKFVLSFIMIIGRLELFPMIIFFTPRSWKNR